MARCWGFNFLQDFKNLNVTPEGSETKKMHYSQLQQLLQKREVVKMVIQYLPLSLTTSSKFFAMVAFLTAMVCNVKQMYVLWFKFILGSNFIFFCFKLIIIHYHTQKQGNIKFEPRIKLNHNICTCTWQQEKKRLEINWQKANYSIYKDSDCMMTNLFSALMNLLNRTQLGTWQCRVCRFHEFELEISSSS